MKRLLIVGTVFLALFAGCKSRVVRITLTNASSQGVSTIEVAYPTATFGVDKLAPGQTWGYTIKPLETGPLKVRYRNAEGRGITSVGPTLYKNNEGTIAVTLLQDSATSKATIR